jgi:hypothetical protein
MVGEVCPACLLARGASVLPDLSERQAAAFELLPLEKLQSIFPDFEIRTLLGRGGDGGGVSRLST